MRGVRAAAAIVFGLWAPPAAAGAAADSTPRSSRWAAR